MYSVQFALFRFGWSAYLFVVCACVRVCGGKAVANEIDAQIKKPFHVIVLSIYRNSRYEHDFGVCH